MTSEPSNADLDNKSQGAVPIRFHPLRIWPAVALLVGMVITRQIPSLVEDGPALIWMSSAFGPAICGILIILWWLSCSRASWLERVLGLVGIIVAVAITTMLSDKTMQGPAMVALTIPVGLAAFAVGAILGSRWLSSRRSVIAVLLAVCGFGFSTLLRNDGLWGDFQLGLHWRWNPSPEEQMLAARKQSPEPSMSLAEFPEDEIDSRLTNPEWPAFRGADRSGRQVGTVVASDWNTNAPEELWKIPVGPGWSSFSVAGPLLFTQEQRGSMETVVCYDSQSGREVWTHAVESRFEDPLGGPGPRATPTLANRALFVLGASGQFMRLDPKTGAAMWEQDLRDVAGRDPPEWGFCSSPLVVGSVAIVYGGGAGDRGTLAFDVETGDLKWSAAAGDHSYSSPQLCSVAGEELVLMLTNAGIRGLDPVTGAERLTYEWEYEGYRALQPQVVNGDTILIPTGMGSGTRCIRVVKDGDEFGAEELWTSRKLKPEFNDYVVCDGYAYGFDGTLLTCISLETGDRQWKGGRYGKGQVLLLTDCGLLLVLSEYGDVVLVKAEPAAHTELAKIKAIEGKTWNHPVVIGDRLYIRNSQETACLRLPLSDVPDETLSQS